MSPANARRSVELHEPSAIGILEEAVHLLRNAGSATLALYLTGAVPFAVGFLFFWTDMARNPFAPERLSAESLGIAILFIWKNVWQALFAARLYRELSSSTSAPTVACSSGASRILYLIAVQAALQPLSWILVTLSSIVMVPFAWTVAFFRNAALFAALGIDRPVAAARRHAGLWTKQNWLILSIVSLAALLLFANILALILLAPQVGRSFLGMEGDLARLGMGLLNLTTVMVAATVTWLFIDPLLDAVYALRCFYGESLSTGEDLRVGLRRALITAAALLLLIAVASPELRAQSAQAAPASLPSSAAARPSVDPQQLDQSIQQVIRRREFAWRSPKPEGDEPEGRWVGWTRSALRTIGKVFDWIGRKIRDWFRTNPRSDSGGGTTERPALEIWIAIAAVLLAVGVAAMIFFRGKRSRAAAPTPVQPAPAAVDLADESVTADQMPESSWMSLAEEWLAKGDCRLAMRALYLAGLNFLGARGLISIRRSKSGGDYRRELERRLRAHASVNPEIRPSFARNVALFERGWYGRHSVDRADVDTFVAGLEEMKRYAGRA